MIKIEPLSLLAYYIGKNTDIDQNRESQADYL